jgi:hypothetical protein
MLGELFEDLRRPDHRHARGLAQPHDLLLELGHPLVAALDGQVAARDHHADQRPPHGRQQQLRQTTTRPAAGPARR